MRYHYPKLNEAKHISKNITCKSINNNKNTSYKNPNQGKAMKRDLPCLWKHT